MFRTSHCFTHKAAAFTSKGVQIRLHVKPNSKKEGITHVQDDCVHVAVTGQAREGEANRGVVDLITRLLGLRKNDASIVSGQRSREKVVLIQSAKTSWSEADKSTELVHVLEKLSEAAARW